MKRFACLFFAAALAFAQASAEVELKSATHREQVQGDLKGAIEAYRKIVAKHGQNRSVAAQAMLRMAECHEKLGQTEARKLYAQLAEQYRDQNAVAAQARTRLSALNGGPPKGGDQVVWTGDGVDIFGRISRDGRFLSYVDWEKTGNLMLRDLVAGTNYPLTTKKTWEDSNESASYSTISWDGKQIAYEWGGEFRVAPLTTTPITKFRSLLKGVQRPYEWSPDGNWISAQVKGSDGKYAVGLIAVRDGSFRKLLDTGWLHPRNMVFTRDGRWVLFDMRHEANPYQHDIYCAATDGSSTFKLLDSSADERVVGFTADFQHLLFSSDQGRTIDLWAQKFENGKLMGTAVNIRADFGKVWVQGTTDSGSVYVTKTILGRDMYIADLDLAGGTAGPRTALKAFPYRGRPDWSPDGQKLSMVGCGASGAEGCEIFIWSKATGKVRELRSGLQYVGFPRWSNDGRKLVTTGRAFDGRAGTFVIDAESGQAEMAVEGPTNGIVWWAPEPDKIMTASFNGSTYREQDLRTRMSREIHKLPAGTRTGRSASPDGKWAMYLADQGRSLRIAPIGGGEERELFRVEKPAAMAGGPRAGWTMNGQALLVVNAVDEKTNKELWLVPLQGQARKLNVDVADWGVTDFGGIGVSRDGKSIAFLSGENAAELWSVSVKIPGR